MTAPLLSIRDLVVNFHGDIPPRTLIDRVSFDLAEGEIRSRLESAWATTFWRSSMS